MFRGSGAIDCDYFDFLHCLPQPAMPRPPKLTLAMPRPTKITSATKRKHHHVPGAHFFPGFVPNIPGQLIAIILIFFHCLSHPAMPRPPKLTSAMPRPPKLTSAMPRQTKITLAMATKRKHHHVALPCSGV